MIPSGTNSQPQSHPTADNITIQTNINTPVQITLRGTGTTPLDVVKFSLVSLPEHGSVTYPYGTPPNMVTYTPNSGFTDKDSFTYKATNGQEVDSNIAKVTITVSKVRLAPKSAHVLWILVSISLVVALYFAYLDTTSKSSLDMILPRTNITISNFSSTINTTTVTTTSPRSGVLSVPQIPRFIILWGYIGAAAYLLKVVTGYLGERTYKNSYLPFHIARLFIGPALAVLAYFILQTGSFFGLSFDITKVPIPLLPYLYAGVAFLTGYFVRSIIETLSKIINGIFNIKESSPHVQPSAPS